METGLWVLVIFLARVLDLGLGTIRVQCIIRRRTALAALIGFFEVLIYIMIVSRVLQDIMCWPYLLAYAGGFAAGTYVGMQLTERLSHRVVQATVIVRDEWLALDEALRGAGFAMTRYEGAGRDGPVLVLVVVCPAAQLGRLDKLVNSTDPSAFLFAQELAGLRGGYLYGMKKKL